MWIPDHIGGVPGAAQLGGKIEARLEPGHLLQSRLLHLPQAPDERSIRFLRLAVDQLEQAGAHCPGEGLVVLRVAEHGDAQPGVGQEGQVG